MARWVWRIMLEGGFGWTYLLPIGVSFVFWDPKMPWFCWHHLFPPLVGHPETPSTLCSNFLEGGVVFSTWESPKKGNTFPDTNSKFAPENGMFGRWSISFWDCLFCLFFREGSAPGPHHFSFREGLFSGECHKSEAFLVDGISDLLQREKVPGLTGRKKDLDLLPPPLEDHTS